MTPDNREELRVSVQYAVNHASATMLWNMQPVWRTEILCSLKKIIIGGRGTHNHGTSSHFHKTADYVGFSAGEGIYNVLFIIICLIFAEY